MLPSSSPSTRGKADVQAGMRELKSNFGLHAFRKHGFLANWAWLLLSYAWAQPVLLGQQLGHPGAGRDGSDLTYVRRDCVIATWLFLRSGCLSEAVGFSPCASM